MEVPAQIYKQIFLINNTNANPQDKLSSKLNTV